LSNREKPLPVPDPETEVFWDGLKQGKLLLQRCGDCGKYRYYPRMVCPHCLSGNTEWVESEGMGIVYSFTIVHKAPPAFQGDTPYVVALIELKEGVRMLSNLVTDEPDKVRIGMPVKVIFEKTASDIVLPKFIAA